MQVQINYGCLWSKKKISKNKIPQLEKNIKENGWRWAYNEYKAPPRFGPEPWTFDDGMLITFVAITMADVITDLVVLVSFGKSSQWGWFGVCLFFFIPAPAFLTYYDHDQGKLSRISFLNILGLRMVYEMFNTFYLKIKRRKLTGQPKSEEVNNMANKMHQDSKKSRHHVKTMKLLQGVVESCPQAVIQGTRLIGLGQFSWIALTSVILSLISVSVACAVTDNSWNRRRRATVFLLVFFFLLSRLFGYSMFVAQTQIYSLCAILPFILLKFCLYHGCESGGFWALLMITLLSTFVPIVVNDKQPISGGILETIFIIGISIFSLVMSTFRFTPFWWVQVIVQVVSMIGYCMLTIIVFKLQWWFPFDS